MENTIYTFNFTFAEIIKIIKGLQKLPLSESNKLLEYIKDNYKIQQKEIKLKDKQTQ